MLFEGNPLDRHSESGPSRPLDKSVLPKATGLMDQIPKDLQDCLMASTSRAVCGKVQADHLHPGDPKDPLKDLQHPVVSCGCSSCKSRGSVLQARRGHLRPSCNQAVTPPPWSWKVLRPFYYL